MVSVLKRRGVRLAGTALLLGGLMASLLFGSQAYPPPQHAQATSTPENDQQFMRTTSKMLGIKYIEPVKPAPPAPPAPPRPAPPAPAQPVYVNGLLGAIGYANPYGNCVLEVPAGRRPIGNPITWAVTTQQPYIGAIALFSYNHVGIVTGIWANGDLEIRHQNYRGGQHRFPRGAFRGFR